MVLDLACISRQDKSVKYTNSIRNWRSKECHQYQNVSSEDWGVILCIDRPGFLRDDEVVCYEESPPQIRSDDAEHMTLTECWKDFLRFPCVFKFPGGLESQSVELTVDLDEKKRWLRPHAVLIAVSKVIDGVPHIVLVKHKKRGWELPGGKIDSIDEETSPEDAAFRELSEEAGLKLDDESKKTIHQIAQYVINEGEHIKSVFHVKIQGNEDPVFQELNRETSASRLYPIVDILTSKLTTVLSPVSPLIEDTVFAVTMRLIQAQL